ncbi:ABC transporter permease [Cupriavidus gilardii]|uniref:ABC transporter permease n=1 Tax=Cupriavidus gilardii TaxID=82541 RepID=UPI001EE568CB|nr:ABC transporter permease [Cupriavidus gilardii]MCG5260641.1 ABC transporter permease [Cupriavidus gilardii]MDF9431844.1 ABC transporter permease [Cupriavidus gilardii]
MPASSLLLRLFCAGVLIYLLAPILSIIPLSFNAEPSFTYPLAGWSLRWYREFLGSQAWQLALKNSVIVAVGSTLAAGVLGTLAALGLSQRQCPLRAGLMAVLVAPMVVPVVITAVGFYAVFAQLGLLNSLAGLIVAHTALGAPFVVITVTATLSRFDNRLMWAAASLGARPLTAFRRVMLPAIAPGIAAGMVFAFVTSLDEVVIALFLAGPEQRTLPRQMWSGMRESISPTITAVASLLIVLSCASLAAAQWLQGRAARQSAGTAGAGSPDTRPTPPRRSAADSRAA